MDVKIFDITSVEDYEFINSAIVIRLPFWPRPSSFRAEALHWTHSAMEAPCPISHRVAIITRVVKWWK